MLDTGDFREQFRAVEQEARDRFVAGSELTEDRGRALRVLVEHGAPELTIRAYMQESAVNMVALGTHGRSAVFDVLIGSTAKRILELAPADVLLVREPRAAVVW